LADLGVKVRLRPAPIRTTESVCAVVRYRQGLDFDRPQVLGERRELGKARAVLLQDLRQIVAREPEVFAALRIPSYDDDFAAHNTAHFSQAFGQSRPMMNGEHRHRAVE